MDQYALSPNDSMSSPPAMSSEFLAKYGSSPEKSTGPIAIAVAGGSASGKTSVCMKIQQRLNRSAVVIALDDFYLDLTEEQKLNPASVNFGCDITTVLTKDHPAMFDFEYLIEVVSDLKAGRNAEIPIYNYKTSMREEETRTVRPADIILVEGIFVLWDEQLREHFDMKIFVDTDSDERLARRLTRDIAERGRTMDSVLTQYRNTVKPAHDEFIQPTMRHADLIIPRGDNKNAMDMIVSYLQFNILQSKLQQSPKIGDRDLLRKALGGH